MYNCSISMKKDQLCSIWIKKTTNDSYTWKQDVATHTQFDSAILCQQNVARLDISVDLAHVMQVCKPLQSPLAYCRYLHFLQWLLVDCKRIINRSQTVKPIVLDHMPITYTLNYIYIKTATAVHKSLTRFLSCE